MEIKITFPGGMKVDARLGRHVVHTDQSRLQGGEDSAPSPFALFLASLGSCAGVYALAFCQKRGISPEGLGIIQEVDFGTEGREKGRLKRVRLRVKLPRGFPEKYIPAIKKAIEGCAVKRALQEPPEFEVSFD